MAYKHVLLHIKIQQDVNMFSVRLILIDLEVEHFNYLVANS